MTIRNSILVYFSVTVAVLTAATFLFIYLSFSRYREEQFRQRQMEKVNFTLSFLTEFSHDDKEIIETIDRMNIHSLLDERLLIFNGDKQLIYSNIDDLPVHYSATLLDGLGPHNRWAGRKEGKYDVIAMFAELNGKRFYGISKASDSFGYAKLAYLARILEFSFIAICVLLVLSAYYIAGRISRPISQLSSVIQAYSLTENAETVKESGHYREVNILTEKFNELMKRLRDSFAFQKHAVHHISHELKTPIAVLVTDLERIRAKTEAGPLNDEIGSQVRRAKSLGETINVLLELAKVEAGQTVKTQPLRIDEIIFDVVDELGVIETGFTFEVRFEPEEVTHENLVINGNEMLIRQAFINVLSNAIAYSDNNRASVVMDCRRRGRLSVVVTNRGPVIPEHERQYVFEHFFRGENTAGRPGFGLGLVLCRRIVVMHGGDITYESREPDVNEFTVTFPLTPS